MLKKEEVFSLELLVPFGWSKKGDGWPLRLQPLNVRVELVRNRDLNGSVSFNTLFTGSPPPPLILLLNDLDTEDNELLGEPVVSGLILDDSGLWDPDFISAAKFVMSPSIRASGHGKVLQEALSIGILQDIDVEDEHDEDSGDGNEDGDL